MVDGAGVAQWRQHQFSVNDRDSNNGMHDRDKFSKVRDVF